MNLGRFPLLIFGNQESFGGSQHRTLGVPAGVWKVPVACLEGTRSEPGDFFGEMLMGMGGRGDGVAEVKTRGGWWSSCRQRRHTQPAKSADF